MNNSPKKISPPRAMPSILDKELEDRSADAFGHQDYAEALRDLIEAPTNKPPFSVGLLGPWGTGKSSIKALYRRDLEDDKTGTVGNRRADHIHVISFNAWRFGGEQDLKRALLREAFKQLGGDENALRQHLFEQVNRVTHERRSFRDWFGESFGQIVGSAVLLLVLFLAAVLITAILVWTTGLEGQQSAAWVAVAAIGLTGWFARSIVDLRVRSPARFMPQTSVSFPTTSAEEYERLLTEQINKFRKGDGLKCERLVVFVDDLDRLSAPEMVAGLDAVRTFLELPFNTSANGFGVVFVISCDEDKIAEAIKRRSGLGSPNLPGAVFSRGDARRYLDRLFQFRLEIPQFPKLDMRDFALKKMQGIESVSVDFKKRNFSLEDVTDRLIHVDVQSPRNAIQLMNAFIQSWWLGSLRERNGIGSDAPGGLHKGAVSDHPLSLAALCVLRVDFPDFYEAVQNRPEIIQEFRSVVFGGKSPSELAPQAQELLKDFLVADNEGSLTGNVRADHRKLRRYLSSLADLRWPNVLQPLLRLAEDPITRKFGDRAAIVFDNLVSGDVKGVLEAFGRHLDDKPLAVEDVVLLEDFGEALPQENETRRTNAARVLAALVDRIPKDRRRRILSPLIRQMAALKAVRMNIQPGRARQIIEGATAEDRRDVSERFINDLLNSKPLDWRLATGGEPNLDEVTCAVKDAVDLALDVRETDGLSAGADTLLRDWLLKREIRLDTESQTLPFIELEVWVDRYGNPLLKYLGTDYSDQAIGELERPEATPEFVAAVLPKISSIFEDIAKLGQQERDVLWSQLTRLVGVQPQSAAAAAWVDAACYSNLAGPDERRAFLIAFADRLYKEMEDGESWPLEIGEGANKFNDLMAEWCADIDPTTAAGLEKLVLQWAEDGLREQFAVRALDLLKGQAKDSWDRVLSKLSEQELSTQPKGISGYLGRNFELSGESVRNQIVGRMDSVISADAPVEETVEVYDALMESMPDKAWSVEPLSGHLVRLLDRIGAMHNTPAYLHQFLPMSATLFKFSPIGKVGQILTQLLANAAGTPKAYVVVHRCMIGAWPKPDEQIGDYRPKDIVARACQFIREQPGNKGIGDVYESICDMVQRGLSGAESSQEIADVTPIVWSAVPGRVSALSSFVASILTPAGIAKILTEAQEPDLQHSDLSSFLEATSKALDEDRRCDAVRAILGSSPVPLFEKPDGALEFWILAATDSDSRFAINLLADDSLNDEQRNRVLVHTGDPALASSPASVEALLKDMERPNARSALVERLVQVGQACGSMSAKSKLAEHMIVSLPSLSGEELHSVARQVYNLGGESALERNDEVLNMLDQEQTDVLAKVFPSSRRLRRAQ
ncbi:KAP family P-loop domain-containing protein [Roseovarius nanhaiticus]|uniref:KAP family P-loop domain-containing protein n=1 Tax=Roseovarius nanhaiticus TaxID=573024 RepID=A0A1N7HKL4_9RHOB|nr:P-loop NTPase fold protein [Roseovarius nanhaiticus]SEL25999.1 KAP family P-loop domain-containing protein [Roseovarius nanhaiticus]SIS25396.1 KAP family P-loop domain-containing protein [Roseovarius nanhaiticus]